jgi:hypothetical protein
MYTEYLLGNFLKWGHLKNKEELGDSIRAGLREMSCEDGRWRELAQVGIQCGF